MLLKLELTMDEANTLGQLLDLAVKAGGIQVAQPALLILGKISDAARATNAAPANHATNHDTKE